MSYHGVEYALRELRDGGPRDPPDARLKEGELSGEFFIVVPQIQEQAGGGVSVVFQEPKKAFAGPPFIAEQASGIGAGRLGDGFVSPVVQQAPDGVCGGQGRVRVPDRDQQAAVAAVAEFRAAQRREGAAAASPGG